MVVGQVEMVHGKHSLQAGTGRICSRSVQDMGAVSLLSCPRGSRVAQTQCSHLSAQGEQYLEIDVMLTSDATAIGLV